MVVICFQISIFEPLNTAVTRRGNYSAKLWFAFKLVSLSHWIQRAYLVKCEDGVVICFQISIFEPLNTAFVEIYFHNFLLWFAFKLVSLSHWIQLVAIGRGGKPVVICFQISIFEPLNTAMTRRGNYSAKLWFAFKLVSLSHWIQHISIAGDSNTSCDLLSN